MKKSYYLFVLLGFLAFFGCHTNTIRRIDVSDREPYEALIGREFVLKKDSYVFSITQGKDILISDCGKRPWIGPAVSEIDPNLIGASLGNGVRILSFYPKGTAFSITKVLNEITYPGCGGRIEDKVIMINIGKYEIVGVNHSWINQNSLNTNMSEIFYPEFAAEVKKGLNIKY